MRRKGSFCEEEASGLVHKGRGDKPSCRRMTQKFRDFVAKRAKRGFAGASCRHRGEFFAAECHTTLCGKSIGRILRGQDVAWARTHRSPKERRRRGRRARRGDLLHMDASPSTGSGMALCDRRMGPSTPPPGWYQACGWGNPPGTHSPISGRRLPPIACPPIRSDDPVPGKGDASEVPSSRGALSQVFHHAPVKRSIDGISSEEDTSYQETKKR